MTATPAPVEASVPVEPFALRQACGLFVTGVTVITCDDEGTTVGTTVNSFASVSLEPPLVLFCLHERSRLRSVLSASSRFAVNFLASNQEGAAWVFAGRSNDAVGPVPQHLSRTGHPVLSGALAFLVCTVTAVMDAGDHVIVLGHVDEIGRSTTTREPLVFYRGAMGPLENHHRPALPIWDG